MHELKGNDPYGNRNYSGAASQYHVGGKNAFGGGVSQYGGASIYGGRTAHYQPNIMDGGKTPMAFTPMYMPG